ncbi:alpha/beta hydrolase [Deinococcus cavernae]|uniref:Alpha/beta hydrolase n=1 Tax=Deinococcus cavernae TaxID=2320857 RepID=A0A418VCL2_9DEIO|nr:alpha/beta hydrolase [Deinococcus cavernae]
MPGFRRRTVPLPGLHLRLTEAGQGEPVLLLHGFPQHSHEWRHIIPELARHYHVIAPDLRGAGQTDAPAGGYQRGPLLQDVLNLLDALHLPRVHLIAHDWSALIGYQLCLQQPQRVASYVALGPHPFVTFNPRMLPGMWRLWFQYAIATPFIGPHFLGGGRQPLARYLFTAHTARPGQWTEAELEPFLAPLRQPARAAGALYRGFILRELAFILGGWNRKKHLTTPTVALHGAQDATLPATFLGGYQKYAPNMTLRLVDGAAHYLADERPDVVTAEAMKLFAAHPISV